MMKKKFYAVSIATICLLLVACQKNSGGESSAITPEQSSNNIPSPEEQYSITRPEFNGDYEDRKRVV